MAKNRYYVLSSPCCSAAIRGDMLQKKIQDSGTTLICTQWNLESTSQLCRIIDNVCVCVCVCFCAGDAVRPGVNLQDALLMPQGRVFALVFFQGGRLCGLISMAGAPDF